MSDKDNREQLTEDQLLVANYLISLTVTTKDSDLSLLLDYFLLKN